MNTPIVRFKEFNSSYQQHKLENLLIEDIKNGTQNNAGLNKDKIKFINVINLYSPIIEHKDLSYVDKELKKIKHLLVEKGDLFYTRSSITVDGIAHCNIYNDSYSPVTFDDHIMRVRINTSVALPDYVRLYSISQPSRKYLMATAKTGTMTTIGQGELKKLSINLPEKKEQEKISRFFQKINKKIKLQQDKIDLLKEQKKGYMQKIFNQELRFKDEDGKTYSDWEAHILGEIGTTFTGLSGKTKDDFGYGNHSFVTYVNVFNNLFAKRNGVEKVNVSENENQAIVQKGDILLTTSSETPLEVGMASIWIHSTNNLHLNSFCFGYRLRESKDISPEFVAISLRSEYMRKKIILLAQGSTRFNMSKSELMKQTINIPSSFEEQIKIVEFYKSLDLKVSLAQQQLESLQLQKQAFMQQMFI